MHKITEVKVLPDYRLDIAFDDGFRGVVDLSSLVGNGVFAAWRHYRAFEEVRIGSSGELVWSDQIDLCPDSLYLKATGKKPEDVFPSCVASRLMPEISRFFGIVIRMFFDDHNPPHFHAIYGENEARIDIRSLSVFAGWLPPRALGLVIEWATLHQQEIIDNWQRARSQEVLHKISPLD